VAEEDLPSPDNSSIFSREAGVSKKFFEGYPSLSLSDFLPFFSSVVFSTLGFPDLSLEDLPESDLSVIFFGLLSVSDLSVI